MRSALILFAALSLSGPSDLFRYKIDLPEGVSVREAMRTLHAQNYDVAGVNLKTHQIEVITGAAGIAALKRQGFRSRQTLRAMSIGDSQLDARYLNPQRTEDALRALNAQYPKLTRLQQIGTSLEGRAIWALEISTDFSASRPTVIFDGMHHAREIQTPEVVMDVATALLGGDVMPEFVQRWNIWIVPMLNVDGNNRVWTENSWWRKNARADAGGGDAYGVDINRNYPYEWAACDGSSSSRRSDDYHGASAGSEPETQALMALGEQTHPAASLSYHSYGEMVLYPYGCDGEHSPENALLSDIGAQMAAVLPSESGGNYTPGTPWEILYSTDGDSMSYLHNRFGAAALALEVDQEFQPPYEQLAHTLTQQRVGWQKFLSAVDQDLATVTVTDASGGAVANASLDFGGGRVFHTDSSGRFYKVLEAGDYALTVTAAAGGASLQTTLHKAAGPAAFDLQLP